MSRSFGGRIAALAGGVVAAVSVLAFAAPALAQAGGPGAQATPVVGVSDTANCPTPVAADQVAGTFASGPFTVGFPAAGSCTSFSANSQGSYTVGGSSPLSFSSSCQTSGLQHGGGVEVPVGTIVNFGAANARTTTTVEVITTPNTVVRFPDGTVATLNVVSTTPTTVTRTAIVSGGTAIGRVICGTAGVYPLAVDTAAAAAPELPSPVSSSGDGGGLSIGVVVAALVALALAAQLAVGARIRRRKGDATA